MHIQSVLSLKPSMNPRSTPHCASCGVHVLPTFFSQDEKDWRGCPSPEQNINPTNLHICLRETSFFFLPVATVSKRIFKRIFRTRLVPQSTRLWKFLESQPCRLPDSRGILFPLVKDKSATLFRRACVRVRINMWPGVCLWKWWVIRLSCCVVWNPSSWRTHCSHASQTLPGQHWLHGQWLTPLQMAGGCQL